MVWGSACLLPSHVVARDMTKPDGKNDWGDTAGGGWGLCHLLWSVRRVVESASGIGQDMWLERCCVAARMLSILMTKCLLNGRRLSFSAGTVSVGAEHMVQLRYLEDIPVAKTENG